jgi:low temperature requirement protein LtrA
VVDEDIGAMRAAVGAYLAARLSVMIAHLVYSFASYHHRAQQRLWVGLSFIGLCLYIPLFVDTISLRSKVAVAFVAIIVEECIWFYTYSPLAKQLLKVKYSTAVDISHEIDRFAAFFIIVLGEFLYKIVVGSPAAIGFNLGLLRAVWTLVIAFCLNWLYVHGDGSLICIHPLRHNVVAAFTWVGIHLPLVASLLAGGHAAASSAASGDDYHHPEIWLLCAGIGIGMICLWAIGLLHKCTDAPGALILPKVIIVFPRPSSLLLLIIDTARSSNFPGHNRCSHNMHSTCPRPQHHRDNVHCHGSARLHRHLGECYFFAAWCKVLGELGGYGVSEGY